jgi:hypothetical protein
MPKIKQSPNLVTLLASQSRLKHLTLSAGYVMTAKMALKKKKTFFFRGERCGGGGCNNEQFSQLLFLIIFRRGHASTSGEIGSCIFFVL